MQLQTHIAPAQQVVGHSIRADCPLIAAHAALGVVESHRLPLARELERPDRHVRGQMVALRRLVRTPRDLVEHGKVAHGAAHV